MSWPNEDEAFKEVAEGIRDVIEGVPHSNQRQSEPVQRRRNEFYPGKQEKDPTQLIQNERSNLGAQGIFHGLVTINQLPKSVIVLVSVCLVGILIAIISPIVAQYLSSPDLNTSLACDAAPTLTEPTDGQTLNVRSVTLTWEAPHGCLPEGYTVRISADRDPEARPWIVDTGWAPTDYTYTFSADGVYYWHIRDCRPCTPFHPGNWAIRIFTIHT